jgi:hypothetical protein
MPTPMLPRALEPSPGQARSWLEEELRAATYHQTPLLDRLWGWVMDRLDDLSARPGDLSGAPTVVTVVLGLLVAGLLLWVVPRVRRERSVRRSAGAVLEDPRGTAAMYRERSARARATGRYVDAVIDSFRAIARDMSDRTLLDDRPGLTAHEVSVAVAAAFPSQAGELARAADLFDSVRYGSGTASPADADDVAALDAALAQARPALPTAAVPTEGPR